ncbi:AC9 transposase [Ceratobasidium sp. AG-Ba]|nr:AC9 transposase [Ceratobasidium sp. AG-Ba]
MALVRSIGAVPESTSSKDYDYDDNLFTEETVEALVADDDVELFERDDEERIDPLVNLQSGISKIRKIAKIVRSSPQRMELFKAIAQMIEDGNERAAKEQNRPYSKKTIKTLILDVVTRWNSLLFMLERAEEFREAIDALTTHPKIKIYRPYALSEDDWATVSRVCRWLKFFRDASLHVSGEKYPTLSFSLRIYFLLIDYLSKLEKSLAMTGSCQARVSRR